MASRQQNHPRAAWPFWAVAATFAVLFIYGNNPAMIDGPIELLKRRGVDTEVYAGLVLLLILAYGLGFPIGLGLFNRRRRRHLDFLKFVAGQRFVRELRTDLSSEESFRPPALPHSSVANASAEITVARETALLRFKRHALLAIRFWLSWYVAKLAFTVVWALSPKGYEFQTVLNVAAFIPAAWFSWHYFSVRKHPPNTAEAFSSTVRSHMIMTAFARYMAKSKLFTLVTLAFMSLPFFLEPWYWALTISLVVWSASVLTRSFFMTMSERDARGYHL